MPVTGVELDASTAARELLGPARRVMPCRGGRNSRVYRVDTQAGTFALKLYPDDGRERGQREIAATTLFAAAAFARVPRPVASDRLNRAAAFSWLEGEVIREVSLHDIDMLVDFAADLHALSTGPLVRGLRDAAEACLSEQAVLDQIQLRLDRLTAIGDTPLLSEFLHVRFAPVLAAQRARIGRSLVRRHASVMRTLSPSDFGFHNALRMPSGALAFLDFEYFGWDDPVKLVADVCWHPGMTLAPDLCERFVAGCREVYRDDAAFEQRLRAAFGLFGLRWCLIVLNEFLPVFWERRVAAGLGLPAAAVLAGQLAKADAILERVSAWEANTL